MNPVVDGLMQEYDGRVQFEEFDFYEDRQVADKYRAPGHPTLVVLKPDGTVVQVLPGVVPKETVVAAIDQALQ